MRILHTADNHIGREAFKRIDPDTKMNARGLDYLESFKNVCKIALNERVDLFIIAGDLFDSPDPNQYYIIECMHMLKRLSKAGITTLIINGNTDISKDRNPLLYLAEIDNVYLANKPDTFILGSYDVVCLPYLNFRSDKEFTNALDKALSMSPSDSKILVSHVALSNAKQGSEAIEAIEAIDVNLIPDRFVYVALGHMHRYQQIDYSIPIFYSGSSERLDFSEEGEDKYALLIEIDGSITVKPYRLPTRRMYGFDLDCSNLKASEINSKVISMLEENEEEIRDALIRIMLYNVDANEKRDIDMDSISSRLKDSFDYVIDVKVKGMLEERLKIPSIEDEINARVKQISQSKLVELSKEILGGISDD